MGTARQTQPGSFFYGLITGESFYFQIPAEKFRNISFTFV
jgi:hypothetical protein